MAKQKTDIQKATGKLISVIQKEWGEALGDDNAEFSENVMDAAHDLFQAGTREKIKALLGTLTVKQYLGEVWVQGHPNVKTAVSNLEGLLNEE